MDDNVHWGSQPLEDKIVQQALVAILNQIYEEDFLGFSYEFRPWRSQHDALDALSHTLLKKKVPYIRGRSHPKLFRYLNKSWMIKFMGHRVADPPILRLIRKWLKAGVMEEGKWLEPHTGRPHGGFTVTHQRVPALQFQSLGERLAPEVGARRGRDRLRR